MDHLRLDRIEPALKTLSPRVVSVDAGVRLASVALLLHQPSPTELPELLFIERARVEGDPWSGHMAFPGGMREPHDPDAEATAARETLEEIGLDPGRALARLDDYDARGGRRRFALVVSPFVFKVTERPKLTLSHEVADAVWIPLASILDPAAATRYALPGATEHASLPAFRHDRFVVWGMTFQILDAFLGRLGASLPR
jgi:8-oxo-dGTP pyrophosphatase MutT (NUDIX family)